MDRRTVTSLLLIFLLPALRAAAVGAHDDPNRVLVVVAPEKSGIAGPYTQLIQSSVKIELQRLGFTPVAADVNYTLESDPVENRDSAEEFLAPVVADEASASLIPHTALCTYNLEPAGRISLDFRWYDVQAKRRLARVIESTPIDLTMDTIITRGTEKLAVQSGIEPVKLIPPVGASPASEEIRLPDSDGVTELPAEGAPAEAGFDPGPGNRFNLSVGFAPLLATGVSTQYFTVGIEPSLNVGYRFRKPGNSVYLGFHTGMTRFVARGVLLETDNYVIPFGAEGRFIFDVGKRWNLFIGAAGGPALFMISSPVHGLLVKLIPFAMAGLGLDIQFSRAVGVAARFSYVFYLEGSIILMGLSPGVNFFLRL
jgi:hypothetical protein